MAFNSFRAGLARQRERWMSSQDQQLALGAAARLTGGDHSWPDNGQITALKGTAGFPASHVGSVPIGRETERARNRPE
jgi:hypothetical protein